MALDLVWQDKDSKPQSHGFYFRKNGKAQDKAFFDGALWFHVIKKAGAEEQISDSPHRDQCRPWRDKVPRGRDAIPLQGEKFAMLEYVKNVGYETKTRRWLCIFKCDCGNEKAMNLYEVRAGKHKSCGCLRDSEQRKLAHAQKMAVWVQNNKKIIDENNARIGQQRRGKQRGIGPCAAWSLNAKAHYFALISPHGERISGWNMQQIVRDNMHLFDEKDLELSGKNYKAAKRLYMLFGNGKKGPINSWKGWRRDYTSDKK